MIASTDAPLNHHLIPSLKEYIRGFMVFRLNQISINSHHSQHVTGSRCTCCWHLSFKFPRNVQSPLGGGGSTSSIIYNSETLRKEQIVQSLARAGIDKQEDMARRIYYSKDGHQEAHSPSDLKLCPISPAISNLRFFPMHPEQDLAMHGFRVTHVP